MIKEHLNRSTDASAMHRYLAAILDAANSYLAPSRLRSYQADIAESGAFVIADARDGASAKCTGTLYHAPKAFSYHFEGALGSFWLLTSPIAQGYALCAVYFPQDDICITDAPFIEAGHLVSRIEQCRDIRFDSGIAALPEMIIGHANFAHFAWNELAALLELQERGLYKPTRLMIIAEPILAIEDLINTSDYEVVRGFEAQLKPHEPHLHSKVLFCPGSEQLTKTVQHKIQSICAIRRPLCAHGPASNEQFTVWISLRLLYRRAINERDAYIVILRRLLTKNTDFHFILDGYSTPNDLYARGRYDVVRERQRQADVVAFARSLIDEFDHNERERILDITGTDLPSALTAAGRANFYICHHGTQQHKIGWFYAVPGVIHAGRPILESNPAGWVQTQSEGTILPHYVPIDLIGDCDSTSNPRQDMPYFADYKFSDLSQLETFIIDHILEEYSRWKKDKEYA